MGMVGGYRQGWVRKELAFFAKKHSLNCVFCSSTHFLSSSELTGASGVRDNVDLN
jgi:hypothetical protein